MRTLCLNSAYLPIRLSSTNSAICKLFVNAAEAIHVQDGIYTGYGWDQWVEKSMTEQWPEGTAFIEGVSIRVVLPSIIRFMHYDKIPKVRALPSRKAVFLRDGYRCYLCGERFTERELTLDHVVPISRGGKSDWLNLATCCKKCNGDKDSKLLSELKMKPKFMPTKPQSSNMIKLKEDARHGPPEWALFI